MTVQCGAPGLLRGRAVPIELSLPAIEPSPAGADTQVAADPPTRPVMQRLLSQPSVHAIVQWQTEPTGGLTGQVSGKAIVPSLLDKSRVLAAQAMASGRVESRMFLSAESQHAVAVPVPHFAGSAISLLFPVNSLQDSQAKLRMQCHEAELAAAQIAIERLASENSLLASLPFVDESLTPALRPAPTTALTWRELRSAATTRLCQSMLHNGSRARTYAMALISFAALGFIPIPHGIPCKVQCEPQTRRFVAAPFDAKLLKCEVKVGQSVAQNQLLAMLDGSDLRSKLAGLEAKLAQAMQRKSAALAQRDASHAALERLDVQQLQQEIEILQNQQQNLEIRSPLAGVVVAGDLQRSEGATLAIGEPLFEIAPLEGLVAEIAIPEADIGLVQVGMSVSISLDATPGRWQQVALEKIHPRNELRDNASVFIGEAAIENAANQLRPGMNGSARIRTGLKPAGWILFHKPYDALRQLIGW